MTKILVISKELQFSRMLTQTLLFNGFVVEIAATKEAVEKHLSEIHFSLLLVDNSFYAEDEQIFYQMIKHSDNRPSVIMMGECYEEVVMVNNMYKSMDDYILKPFGMSELKMIINRQLERRQLMTKPIVYGDLRIDVARSLVFIKNNMVNLGRKEMEILIILAKKAGKIACQDKLLTRQRIEILSRKLRTAAGEALQIKSVSGLGYRLVQMDS